MEKKQPLRPAPLPPRTTALLPNEQPVSSSLLFQKLYFDSRASSLPFLKNLARIPLILFLKMVEVIKQLLIMCVEYLYRFLFSICILEIRIFFSYLTPFLLRNKFVLNVKHLLIFYFFFANVMEIVKYSIDYWFKNWTFLYHGNHVPLFKLLAFWSI